MKRLLRASPLAVVIAVVVAAATVAGFFLFKNSADSQERTLLESDASQAALYVGSVFDNVGGALDPVATAVVLAHGSVAAFQSAAAPLAKSGEGLTVVLALRQGTGYVVESAAGPAFTPGELLDASISASLANAGATALVGPVLFNGTESSTFFAVGPPLTPAGSAIFLQFSLNPYMASPVTAASPFALLKVALYGTSRPTTSSLLVATAPASEVPLGSDSVTEQAKVAGSKWALVAEARSPLIGSFARQAPYIILGLGLFVAVLVGVTITIFDRRQRYAAALVAERTADLQSTLVDLRSAQHALIRAERLTALGEMATVVGHELRNPLAAVINALYLLRRQIGEPLDPAYEKNLAMAERETTKAATLAEDLTAFVRPRQPKKELVELSSLVSEVVQSASPPPRVAIETDQVEPISVVADRNQLAEVLTNLITNAYQAVGDQGTVRVAAKNGSREVELSVEDTGPGIDQETAARVFEPFFTTKHDGTGLGLAIVQRLVEGHGGTVAFDDAARAEGARVVVHLPADATAAS